MAKGPFSLPNSNIFVTIMKFGSKIYLFLFFIKKLIFYVFYVIIIVA